MAKELPIQSANNDRQQDSSRCPTQVRRWQGGKSEQDDDLLITEVAVALVYNGISHAVMMATPTDLEDFALGFSLSEQILQRADELHDLELVSQPEGIEIRMRIAAERMAGLKQIRRNLTGRSGCGLCGAESLQQAIRPLPTLNRSASISNDAIQQALAQLPQHQLLQQSTGACHGAAWCDGAGDILLLREDVGRHNALDKLIGSLACAGQDVRQGFVLVSSRASYEMVHKTISAGIGCLVAVSAPTSLALKLAQESGLQLVGFARLGRHVQYHPV